MSNERSPSETSASKPNDMALSPQSAQVQRGVKSIDENIDDTSEKSAFPFILHDVVCDPATDDCIHWLPDGKLFLICDKKKFAKTVLPKFPGNGVFTSFTRRLKRWGFQRISSGPQIGAYKNENFMKGDKERINNIKYMIPKRLSLVTIRKNMAKLQAAKTLNMVKALAVDAVSEELSLSTDVESAHVVITPDLKIGYQLSKGHQAPALNPSMEAWRCLLTSGGGNSIAPNTYHMASMMSKGPSLAAHLAMIQSIQKQQNQEMTHASSFSTHISTNPSESFGEMLVRTNPRLAAQLIESRGLLQGVQPIIAPSSDLMSLFTGNNV
ncbi:hypothetical protein HJC23_012187 [Cyclotella cryptica]|uniref:HSF-type DNA-binding domain-containing protein n=1 Tax=Cyclotella cryptica TaxID=29204 RepID=A0ABD3PUP1_9STRA|eukprot:CCRYP_011196-RA/>CCRYP_011196-RA protein AED:0.19 eAED:-0.04 QI:0/-1/0/1/-1/1/1/0/324